MLKASRGGGLEKFRRGVSAWLQIFSPGKSGGQPVISTGQILTISQLPPY